MFPSETFGKVAKVVEFSVIISSKKVFSSVNPILEDSEPMKIDP